MSRGAPRCRGKTSPAKGYGVSAAAGGALALDMPRSNSVGLWSQIAAPRGRHLKGEVRSHSVRGPIVTRQVTLEARMKASRTLALSR